MILNKPKIFNSFPNIQFVFSKKSTNKKNDIFNFNMSKSIGDIEELVLSNRAQLYEKLSLNANQIIIQKQTHSDKINYVEKFVTDLEGDSLITKSQNLGLAISTADCTNIYLYDSEQKIIAAVHSGWLGTEKKILEKTVIQMEELGSNPKSIYAYVGPSISQKSYEVGREFLNKFDKRYMLLKDEKFILDLKLANKDMLLNCGVPEDQIEISDICSYENSEFHSYRRDKKKSGRAFGVIAMKDGNEI